MSKHPKLKAFIHERLSRNERLLLILYYYEDLNFQEIAMVMDMPEFRVREMQQALAERIKRFMHSHGTADAPTHAFLASGNSAVA